MRCGVVIIYLERCAIDGLAERLTACPQISPVFWSAIVSGRRGGVSSSADGGRRRGATAAAAAVTVFISLNCCCASHRIASIASIARISGVPFPDDGNKNNENDEDTSCCCVSRSTRGAGGQSRTPEARDDDV